MHPGLVQERQQRDEIFLAAGESRHEEGPLAGSFGICGQRRQFHLTRPDAAV